MHSYNIIIRKNRKMLLYSALIFLLTIIIALYLFDIRKKYLLVTDTNNALFFESKRLVWLEQLPIGDRIKNQLDYIPKGYNYEKTPVKTILIYTGMGASWERPLLGQGLFFGCPVSQCMLTINNSLAPQVDAVLFRHVYVPPSYKRPRNQIWIIEHTEPPFLTVPINDNGVFNWTANYRWDSDIPRPYGYFKKYEPEQPVPSIVKNYAEGKTKLVAWFVSNCQPFNKRNEYAAELSKHITVDIYGRCGTLTCSINDTRKCLNMLNKNYKFYLAFENSNCKYYITEKLFTTSLGRNLLPIVMGASRMEYELVAPNHSFIHVDDFKSAEDLAMYLHKLDKNDELYNEYFKWKDTGTIVIYNKLYCRICAMLHDKDHPPKHYTNLSKWWSGPDVCHP